MNYDADGLDALVAHTGPVAVDLVGELHTQAGAAWFYVFWNTGAGDAGAGARRPRTLLAFATPDAALVFAQRNALLIGPTGGRLRRISLARLLLAVVREPAIIALVLIHDSDSPPPPGQIPQGLRIERADLLARLQG
jgi:hypothetical protein